MKQFLAKAVVAVWGFLRTTWLVIGVCVLLLVLGEGGYRALGIARRGVKSVVSKPSAPGIDGPQVREDWFREYWREFNASSRMSWRPYVYFRRQPWAGQYVVVDSAGHRVTVPAAAGMPAAHVYFFGGSTMWGTGQRNEHTIPSEASRRLQASGDAGGSVDVTNFGEAGYVSSQELLELITQLRAGLRPDVVVFYDGINDVVAALQSGVPGIPQNESKRVAEFAMGRSLEHGGRGEGIGSDLRAAGTVVMAGIQQLELAQRLEEFGARGAAPLISVDSAVHGVVRVYTENVRMIEALSHTYGFIPLYVWQPTIHATKKQLTPFEAQIFAGIKSDPLQHRIQAVHLAIPGVLDTAMTHIASGRFVDASSLFAGDTTSVFIDSVGHTTERAVIDIVNAMWPMLTAALQKRAHAPRP